LSRASIKEKKNPISNEEEDKKKKEEDFMFLSPPKIEK